MSDKVQVFPSTGGISIEVTAEQITIEQEDLSGESPSSVWIPRPLFKEVLSSIFAQLDMFELREIAELAETHGTKPAKG